MTIEDFNTCGEDLERILHLTTSPIAVKMLKTESEIPRGALRPKKDHGYHLAQCQAFSISRRDRKTVAMLKEDNWCPAPLIAYGMVNLADAPEAFLQNDSDRFEYGKYIGVLTAPLKSAAFEPNVVIMYSDTNQLRSLLLSLKPEDRKQIGSHYFPPSCGHAVVTPIITGRYQIVLPDPGEYARALTMNGEMMFAIPQGKLKELVANLKEHQTRYPMTFQENMILRPDFPQPDFYKKALEHWGMDHEK